MLIFNKKSTKEKRRLLKINMTTEEIILWEYLRKDKLGFRFRRQYGINQYIVDFYCPKLKLVIELDGKHHYLEKNLKYDKVREKFLEGLGLKVIRIKNEDINENLNESLYKIDEVVKSLKT